MLSDEEREALEILNNTEWDGFMITIKNLIDKQSKEIEELTLDLEEMTKSNNHKKENWVHKSILNSYVSKKESEQRERKAYIKGTNDAHELCNKKWEDKIKAKIEEIEKELEEYENGQEWEIQDELRGQIDVLLSLLEKE